ncbi:MAG: hypothetical protein ACM32O_12540 [Clostridia bacterium]
MKNEKDQCISCGEELAINERNRAKCWNCREETIETYCDHREEKPEEGQKEKR